MPTEELTVGDKKIILVGTAHVSNESVKAVEYAIKKHKPDAIAVELCKQRYEALKHEKKWDDEEMGNVISSDRVYLFLLQILLGNFQRRIGDEVGVKPGSEMMKAIELAEKNKVKVVLADRDIKITLKRAMEKMSFIEKFKILTGLMGGVIEGEEINKELVEKLKQKDVLTEMMEELAIETPSIKKVLVDERDEYIAHSIYTADAKTIVAVVGAGHMDGIIKILNELGDKTVLVKYTHTIEGVKIRGISKKKIRAISYLVPAIFAAIIIWGFIQRGLETTAEMILWWLLINGTLSALGVLIARGHPASITAAFLAAPITSLNPAIAAGWVAGYVELKVRKPRVSDFKNMMKLKTTKDYFKNRVVKVVIIVVFANIGSTIGTIIGLPYIASLI
jgi:pheromone shutdown-related protein TraB